MLTPNRQLLIAIRKELGLTQESLAKETKKEPGQYVSKETISNYERGKSCDEEKLAMLLTTFQRIAREKIEKAGDSLEIRERLRRVSSLRVYSLTAEYPIGRQELYDWICDAIQADGGPRTIALHGAAGIGKTHLVEALNRDAFLHWIFGSEAVYLWSIGQHTDPFSALCLLGARLGLIGLGRDCERDMPSESTREAKTRYASERIQALLSSRRILLLIDDVWKDEEFLNVTKRSPRSIRVVTTREESVALSISSGLDMKGIPDLKEPDAIAVLRYYAPEISSTDPNLSALSVFLEYRPIALRVAAGLLATHEFRLEDLATNLKRLRAEPGRILEETVDGRCVSEILDLSVNRLDQMTKKRYEELGAFPEETPCKLAELAAVWHAQQDLTEEQFKDAERTVRILVAKHLLDPIGHDAYKIHMLIRMHAKSLLQKNE